MDRARRVLGLVFFMVRFLVLVVVLMVGWWTLVPYYGLFLAQVSAGLLNLMGMAVTGVGVVLEPETILNTGTKIFFQIPTPENPQFQPTTDIALLVTNLAPYLALVLASAGITMRRRLLVLLFGTAIIVGGHILFLVALLRFQDLLREYHNAATSVIQLFLVMPVLLWVWFVYSERIVSYLDEEEAAASGAVKIKELK